MLFTACGTARGIGLASQGSRAHLHGLDADAAAALLADQHRVHPCARGGELVARTGGNPLALLEIPPLLDAGAPGRPTALPDALPIGARDGRTFLARDSAAPRPDPDPAGSRGGRGQR